MITFVEHLSEKNLEYCNIKVMQNLRSKFKSTFQPTPEAINFYIHNCQFPPTTFMQYQVLKYAEGGWYNLNQILTKCVISNHIKDPQTATEREPSIFNSI